MRLRPDVHDLRRGAWLVRGAAGSFAHLPSDPQGVVRRRARPHPRAGRRGPAPGRHAGVLEERAAGRRAGVSREAEARFLPLPQEERMMARGFALFAGTTPETIRASAREAEALGYSSFWVNHPGSVDGPAALAFGARETRSSERASGVVPRRTRGPEAIVQGVPATALPLERLLLAVASPTRNSLS